MSCSVIRGLLPAGELPSGCSFSGNSSSSEYFAATDVPEASQAFPEVTVQFGVGMRSLAAAFGGLRTFITELTLALPVLLGLLGGLGVVSWQKLENIELRSRADVDETLAGIAVSTNLAVEQWLNARRADVRALASKRSVVKTLVELTSLPQKSAILGQHATLSRLWDGAEEALASGDLLAARFVDVAGTTISTVGEDPIDGGAFAETRPPIAASRQALYVKAQVWDEDGQNLGTIEFLVNLNGRLTEIARSFAGRHSLSLQVRDESSHVIAASRAEEVRRDRSAAGRKSLGAWHYNAALGLSIGAEIDEVDALRSFRETRNVVLEFAFGMFALAVLSGSIVILGRRRLRRIARSVDAVAARRVGEQTAELLSRTVRLERELEERRTSESALRRAQHSLEESSEHFARLSRIDALTNLANRRTFDEFIEREWRRSIRHNTPISLLLIDLDYFKLFNDTYGHASGDDCLREIAGVISSAGRRPGDLVARLGGEEFAVILCDTDTEGAKAVAHHIQVTVEGLAIDHEMTMVADADILTVSIGVVTKLPEPSSGPSRLLYHADEALHLAKQEGRNCVRAYEDFPTQSQSSTSLRVPARSLRPNDTIGRKGR